MPFNVIPIPIQDSFAHVSLPAAGTVGRIVRQSDGCRGVWMDTGAQWFSTTGETFNVKEFGAVGHGVADDTLKIQAAIGAARAAGGGIVYMPPGTYLLTNCLEIYDCDNVTLRGAGKSTILDGSALTHWHRPHQLIGPLATNTGLITVAPSNGQPEPENITLADFTILGPTVVTGPEFHVIFVGGTRNCRIARVKVDGSVNEAVYIDPFAGYGFDLYNLVVEGCEICNFDANGINTNTVVAHGVTIRGNYIHNGFHGVNMIGNGVSVENNYFNDCACGISATADMATALEGISIRGNRIENAGLSYPAGILGVRGIVFVAPDVGTDCGYLIANNTILPLRDNGVGMEIYAPCSIIGNVISGVYGTVAKGNYERAIWLRANVNDVQSTVLLANNVIEAAEPDAQWSNGIFIDNDVLLTVHSSNNLVRPGAIRAASPFGAYYDERGASTLNGDVFHDWFAIGPGAQLNAGGEMSGKPLHYGDIGTGAIVANKVTAREWGDGLVHKTILTFTLTGVNDLDLANGADHGTGVRVYGFPAGRIHIIGATIDAITVNNGAFNADPNDVFYLSCGSVVAADDGTLTGTEADIIPATTMDTSGGIGLVLLWKNALAASAVWDGTGTALDLYVNAAVADACTSGAVTIAIVGTMTIHWVNLGDY